MGSGIVGQYADPKAAEGLSHLFSGGLIFLLSLLLLVVFDVILTWFERHMAARQI
jgi:hypothetical protein